MAIRLWVLSIFLSFYAYSSVYRELSTLERSVVDEAMAVYALVPQDNPENKRIRNIFIYTSSPFDSDSGFLSFLNCLHVNTKDHIIRRELFFKPGDTFDSSLIKDSEIILSKRSRVRSVSVIIPVNSESSYSSDEVDLLVATNDLLSLGLSFNFAGSAQNITNFMVSLAENNFLGFNKSMSLAYEMEQGSQSFASNYFDPNLFGSRFQFSLSDSLIYLRRNFAYDGFSVDAKIAKPLLSQNDRFGYGLSLKMGKKTVFDFQGGKLRDYEIKTESTRKTVPRTYGYRYGSGSLFGTYSLGTTYKNEFSLGYGFNLKKPSVLSDLTLTPAEEEQFKNKLLPRDEIESFITLGYSHFHNRFLILYDYENFRVQETLRVGPSFGIANDFASSHLFFSDYSFLRPRLSLSFLQPFGDDSFLSLTASSSNRFDGAFTDNTYRTGFTLVSPKIFGLGRAILAGSLAQTYDNRDNQKFVVGSDSGSRGVESRFYSGNKGFTANVELRSAPMDLWILHVGLAIFYDVGAAFDKWPKANPTHALGFGLRMLAPQVSSLPFRFDLAFPIYGLGKNYHTVVPSFGVGQAF